MKLHQKEIFQDNVCSRNSLTLTEDEQEFVRALREPMKRAELIRVLNQPNRPGCE